MTDEEIWNILSRGSKFVKRIGGCYNNANGETIISINAEFYDERNYRYGAKKDVYRVCGNTFGSEFFDIDKLHEATEYAEQCLIKRGYIILV